MPLRHSGDFPFENPNRTTSMCNLEVFQTSGQTLVLATEIERNPGMSVENCSARFATIVQRTFALDVRTTIFVTHVGPMSYAPGGWRVGEPDRYSIVRFHWSVDPTSALALWQQQWLAQQPQWYPTTEQEVIALLCELTDEIAREDGICSAPRSMHYKDVAIRQAEEVIRGYWRRDEHDAR